MCQAECEENMEKLLQMARAAFPINEMVQH